MSQDYRRRTHLTFGFGIVIVGVGLLLSNYGVVDLGNHWWAGLLLVSTAVLFFSAEPGHEEAMGTVSTARTEVWGRC